MDERNFTVEGIVLRSRNYKDTDKIVTFFSPDRGKLVALAKGARKTASSLRGAVQPFCRSAFLLAKTKSSMDIITQARQEQGFSVLSTNLERIAYASYIVELTDAALPLGKPATALYPVLLVALSLLDMDDDLPRAARYYELKLLQELGALPDLHCCCCCGRSLTGGRFYLSPERGGLLCASCADSDGLLIGPGAILTMQRLLDTDLGKLTSIKSGRLVAEEMEKALAGYLDYYLEYAVQARSFINRLKVND